MDDETVVGFDGAANDTYVVVMRRPTGGHWEIENTDGPCAEQVSELIAAALARMPVREPAWSTVQKLVADMTSDQRDLLAGTAARRHP